MRDLLCQELQVHRGDDLWEVYEAVHQHQPAADVPEAKLVEVTTASKIPSRALEVGPNLRVGAEDAAAHGDAKRQERTTWSMQSPCASARPIRPLSVVSSRSEAVIISPPPRK